MAAAAESDPEAGIARSRVDLGQESAVVDGLKSAAIRKRFADINVMSNWQQLLSVMGILFIATIGGVAAQGTLPTQAPASTAQATTKPNVKVDGENSMTKASHHRRSVNTRVRNGDYVYGKVHYRLKSAK